MTVPVDGHADPAFEPVRTAFAANWDHHPECGAAVSVTLHGKPVVDLWGGWTDADRRHPWERDTLVCVFSSTKGLAALCAHILVDRGVLDLDEPVARWWPEFAQAGKETLPLRMILNHQSGVAAPKKRLAFGALSDWRLYTEALAETPPFWEPGTAHGYHGVTFGHLVGEVIRRADGRTIGRFLHDEVLMPLGLDGQFHLGLPQSEFGRTATLLESPPIPAEEITYSYFSDPKSLGAWAFGNPPDCNSTDHTNSEQFRTAEIPSANGHGTARALARIYGTLAEGGPPLLSPDALRRATAVESDGPDRVMEMPTRFSLGFQLPQPDLEFGPNPRSFGHTGSGGSIGFADPDTGLGFGYAMNQMIWASSRTDPRWARLVDATYSCL